MLIARPRGAAKIKQLLVGKERCYRCLASPRAHSTLENNYFFELPPKKKKLKDRQITKKKKLYIFFKVKTEFFEAFVYTYIYTFW